jgi:hypothetical protein
LRTPWGYLLPRYPPGVLRSRLANLGLMGRAGTVLRAHRLRLLLGVAAVALSVLILHQFSLNHTAAHPTAANKHLSATSARQLDGHDAAAIDDDHTHLVPLVVDRHQPALDNGACPGCSGHHAMALTCLAALMLLALGWVLRRPAEWRGVRLPRTVPDRSRHLSRNRRRPAFTLVDLSVSRT